MMLDELLWRSTVRHTLLRHHFSGFPVTTLLAALFCDHLLSGTRLLWPLLISSMTFTVAGIFADDTTGQLFVMAMLLIFSPVVIVFVQSSFAWLSIVRNFYRTEITGPKI